jgi:hypothetical protein
MPAQDGSSATLLQDAHAQVELDSDAAPLGLVNVEADRADPWLGDDGGSPLRDLVMRGTGLGTPVCTALGDAI